MGHIPPRPRNTESNKQNSEFAESIKKTLDLEMNDMMQVYKPWLNLNIVFSLYLRPTGQQKSFKTVKQFPLQVIKDKQKKFKQRGTIKEVTNNDEIHLKRIFDTLFKLNDGGANFSNYDIGDEITTIMIEGVKPVLSQYLFLSFDVSCRPRYPSSGSYLQIHLCC